MARELGPGEARERASRSRWIGLIVAAAILGGISGATAVISTHGDGGLFERALPVWVAVLLAAGWLGIMIYSAWYYETKVDEVERNANYYGYAIGGGLVLLLYPVWYMFWWAGMVREPTHEALMGTLLIAALAGYLWKKYR